MNPFVVLGGSGPVASQESALIIEAVLLMLVIITPVLALLFYFAWRYRKGSGARWEPEWEHSRMDELVWWAVPVEVVLVLGALAWQGTHALDPHRALASSAPALTVEVVALPWKWLFIYPAYGVASVNFAEIPAGVPVNFEITADAPMNAFWVPALGGMIMAMPGMVNPLSLQADWPGDYQGYSALYSGAGFADMRFSVRVRTESDFKAWLGFMRTVHEPLDQSAYELLAAPGTTTQMTFSNAAPGLFAGIVARFAEGGAHAH